MYMLQSIVIVGMEHRIRFDAKDIQLTYRSKWPAVMYNLNIQLCVSERYVYYPYGQRYLETNVIYTDFDAHFVVIFALQSQQWQLIARI